MSKQRALFAIAWALGFGMNLGINLVRQSGFQQSNIAMVGLLIWSFGMSGFMSTWLKERRARKLKNGSDDGAETK